MPATMSPGTARTQTIAVEFSKRLTAALDQARLRVLDASAHSENLVEFFQQSVPVVVREIPIAGLAVWVVDDEAGKYRVAAASGLTFGRDAVLKARPDGDLAELRSSLTAGSPEYLVQVIALDQPRKPIAIAWIPRALVDHFQDERWIAQVFSSGLESLRLIDHARQSLSVLSAFVRHLDDPLIGLDASGNCLLWNPAAERLFGWPAEDCLNRPFRVAPKSDQEAVETMIAAARTLGRASEQRLTGRRWDGHEFPILVRALPVRHQEGDFPSLILQVRSLAESQAQQLATRLVIDGLQAIILAESFAAAGLAVVRRICADQLASGAELWIAGGNSGEWDLLACWPANLPACDGERRTKRFLAEIRAQFTERALPSAAGDLAPSVRSRQDEGSIGIPIGFRNQLLGALLIRRSATDPWPPGTMDCLQTLADGLAQRLSEEQTRRQLVETGERLKQVEKLSSLGLLTSTVAHDLNNILTVMYGYCAIARNAPESVPHCVGEIHRAADNAGRLARQLLQFTRRTSTTEVLSVAGALDDLQPLLVGLLAGRGQLSITSSEPSAAVELSRSEFDQLLLNLVANARDALGDVGQVAIQVSRVLPDLHLLSRCPHLKSGPTICLQVVDNGCGIPETGRQRIFEPFYTTKPAGVGTGIGLDTVRQIVERHGGGVCVESELGRGTTMSLFLPQATKSLSPRVVSASPTVDPRGTERVLLLEADDRLRQLLSQLLQLRGYRVSAFNPQSVPLDPLREPVALAILGSPDLLTAPWRPLQLIPRTAKRLVLCDVEAPLAGLAVTTLLKPFTSDEFSRAVRQSLDG